MPSGIPESKRQPHKQSVCCHPMQAHVVPEGKRGLQPLAKGMSGALHLPFPLYLACTPTHHQGLAREENSHLVSLDMLIDSMCLSSGGLKLYPKEQLK